MKKQKVNLHLHSVFINETVQCAVCDKTIGLRDGQLDKASGLAWLDPYNHSQYFFKSDKKAGCYVCRGCLSEQQQNKLSNP